MRIVAAVAAAAWLAIYFPDAGRGFIKDDFAWLLAAPLSADPWSAAWTAPTGFFRPLVSLSFTANHALFDLNPLGYGMTNVALALGCAGAIYLLARAWGISEGGALIAAGAWLFTPHGMDMAVIWISGRSGLLLVIFAALTCWAAARGWIAAAVPLLACALLSKDDAIVVPILAVISMIAAGRGRDRTRLPEWIAACVLLAGAYFWMRSASGAMTPWSAPEEYRPSLDAALIASNVLQYADRLLTFPVMLAAVIWLSAGWKRPAAIDARVVLSGLAWAAIAMAPTVALPVRSSLYTLMPLVGTALALGAVADGLLRDAAIRRARMAAAALAVVALAAVPIYRSRQHEWSDAAGLSASLTADIRTALSGVAEGSRLAVQDRHGEPNLESTFGNLLPEMLQVITGKRFELVHARERGDSILLAPVPR